jgi:hypothetical protein
MRKLGLMGFAIAPLLAMLISLPALAQRRPVPTSPQKPESRPARRYTCPTETQPLTNLLLRDLPGYVNRVYTRVVYPQVKDWTYAILASQPEFEPLPVNSREYPNPQDESLQQVFFTILERQYRGNQSTLLQQYHWLFLTRTQSGWQIAFMFSRVGAYPTGVQTTLTPPRESSEEITAQAIRLWLRDCEAGVIKPLR